ncbi:unnamed protein product [Clavelina lepadiformis]|uniref:Multidrug resistance-associated protein 5 n=1 Tax=Clavelina lepadiformis TaxID=159417 RepID=A0ABP0G2A3_CLALP
MEGGIEEATGVQDSQQLITSCTSDDQNLDTSDDVSFRSKSFLEKYGSSLKNLIPIRPRKRKESEHPNDAAGLFSTITFSWMTVLVVNAFRHPPTTDDLWELSQYDQAQTNYQRFANLWREELRLHGKKNASVWRTILKFVRTRLILAVICSAIFAATIFTSSAIIMRQLLLLLSKDSMSLGFGFILVGILLAVELTRAFFFTAMFVINYRTAVRTRAAVLLMVFKKVIKMSPVIGTTTVGELLTVCSNDGDRLFEANRFGASIFLGPTLFIAGTIYTTFLLGPIGLVGSFVFIAVLPLQGVLIRLMSSLRLKALEQTELRVMKINEILTSVKLIKMYAWESSFSDVVEKIRRKELSALRTAAFLQSINISMAFLTPVLASVIMIVAYVLSGNNLKVEDAFTAIAVFNAMAYALKVMPLALKSLADVNISMQRFRKILLIDNLEDYVLSSTDDKANAIEMKDAAFMWKTLHLNESESKHNISSEEGDNGALLEQKQLLDDNSSLQLKDISLRIRKGSLVGICGAVGSGKSSLIAGMMGYLHLQKGSVSVSGTIAFVGQQAWLMNATVRENILFGLPFEAEKYSEVVMSCDLGPDFESLPSRDLTEVGERGINLSGGQKQRISLARALYSDRDIYLLDDPLSAVDAHVGKHIFQQAILGKLKKGLKTVLLVTHQLQYLPQCDQVLIMDNGSLTETTEQEIALHRYDFIHSQDEKETVKKEENEVSAACIKTCIESSLDDEEKLLVQGKLMIEEERGDVISLAVYAKYFRAAGGPLIVLLIFLFFCINVAAQQFSNFWLSYWLSQGSGAVYAENTITGNSSFVTTPQTVEVNASTGDLSNMLANPKFNFYLLIYALSAIAMFAISFLRGYAFVCMVTRASLTLHASLFKTVLHSTMTFFDTNPTGRIINRFHKDMDEQDVAMPVIMEMFLLNFTTLLFAMGLIAFVFPKFLIVVAVVCPVFFVIYTVFKPAAREMRRLDFLTRSPWFSHITTAITGLPTIRIYRQTQNFVKRFSTLLDTNGIPCYLFACVNRWLALRLDLLMIVICIITAIFVILNQGLISPAFAGLAISSAFLMSGMLQFTVRLLIEGEARFVCVDRIKYYIENTPQESSDFSVTPQPTWPNFGIIEFKNVNLRYRNGLPLALENITFEVKQGEKIGIVGRTGSGKSSLTTALFRLVELDSGTILIDGIDISMVSQRSLRSKLSIIPQDPVLFSGTVRYNLDPFNELPDDDIWNALEQTCLKSLIAKFPDKLGAPVVENGNNFSVGERQLICLARALLRRSKILILDEATAAVDNETEAMVHDMIEKVFSDCTVLTIAHRLPSVAFCDRVMVLDAGKLVEFDCPKKLMQVADSKFAKLLSSFQAKHV